MPANVPRSEDYPALVHFYDDAYTGTPCAWRRCGSR
jgi:two-component system sensor histidine kinase TctE